MLFWESHRTLNTGIPCGGYYCSTPASTKDDPTVVWFWASIAYGGLTLSYHWITVSSAETICIRSPALIPQLHSACHLPGLRPVLEPILRHVLRPGLRIVLKLVLRLVLKPVLKLASIHVLRLVLKPVSRPGLRPVLRPQNCSRFISTSSHFQTITVQSIIWNGSKMDWNGCK